MKESRFKYYAIRICLLLASAYIALFIVEIGFLLTPKTEPIVARGIVVADKDAGYGLKPNFSGYFDDGYAKGEIRINSLGYRDEEPRTDAARRVLLVGDSFTFGTLLDQDETIDKQLERLDPATDVCSLGVGGYNLPQQLVPLKRWTLPADEVVYLFVANDLQEKAGADFGEFEGQLVRLIKSDRTRYTDSELRKNIAERDLPQKKPNLSFQTFYLRNVRRIFQNFVLQVSGKLADKADETTLRDDWENDEQRDSAVSKAIGYTNEMQAIAEERKMKFRVVIIPKMEEVEIGKYSLETEKYVESLRNEGIPTIELLKVISVSDYWRHDGHFNAKGAKTTAKIIYESLKKQEL